MKKSCLLLLILCMAAGYPAAQQAPADPHAQMQHASAAPAAHANTQAAGAISITAQTIPSQVSFATPFDIRFELAHEPGYVTEINKESLPQDFELTAQKTEKLSPGTAAYQLTFVPFTLGASTFTAVTFELKEQAGGKTLAQAGSEPQIIDVQPVQYFKDPNLRDIRPPYIPSSWLVWLLCLAALGLIAYFLRRFYQDTRAKKMELQQTRDDRPADVIALSKIEALLQSGLWEKAQYKMFYIELGEILREYFWRRFQQDVSSDTSIELLRRARKTPQLAPLLTPLRDYLNSSDLVKFAKVTPSQDAMQKDVGTVREIVRETSPKELTKEGR